MPRGPQRQKRPAAIVGAKAHNEALAPERRAEIARVAAAEG